MSRKTKIQFQQWMILVVAWQIMGLWICVYDHLAIHSGLASSPAKDYSFVSNLALYSAATFIASLLGGSLLIFYINRRFANRSYGSALLAVVLLIVFVMSIITLITAWFYVTIVLNVHIGDPGFGKAFGSYVSDPLNLKDTLIWATITAVTQFIFQMNNKFGPGVLWKIITGKYRQPRAEDKIFMFVDLNSSTSIAERLEEVNYHRLLKDFFAHVTNPIVENNGEIYQYVGDEIVVAWSLEKGVRDNQCIQCFFEMKEEIEKNSDYYRRTYGVVPSFKAGIHSGNVIAGEIGIYKRDITFSGDVLNTTSRIRSLCKEFDVDLIASSELLHNLHLTSPYIVQPLGAIELRGRRKRIELSSLARLEPRMDSKQREFALTQASVQALPQPCC